LKEWISQGGIVIAWKNGGKWLSDEEITKVSYFKDDEEKEERMSQVYFCLKYCSPCHLCAAVLFQVFIRFIAS